MRHPFHMAEKFMPGGGDPPDGTQISGQYLGASDTFAGLPAGGDASIGDYAILTQADGIHEPGRYWFDGAQFVFELAFGGSGGFIIHRDPQTLSATDFANGPTEAVFATHLGDKILSIGVGAADGSRLKLVSEGLYRVIVSGDISFEITGSGSVDFEKKTAGWVPFNPQPSIPKI